MMAQSDIEREGVSLSPSSHGRIPFPSAFFDMTSHVVLLTLTSLSLPSRTSLSHSCPFSFSLLGLSLSGTISLSSTLIASPRSMALPSLSCPMRRSLEVRRGRNLRPQLVGSPDTDVWSGGGA